MTVYVLDQLYRWAKFGWNRCSCFEKIGEWGIGLSPPGPNQNFWLRHWSDVTHFVAKEPLFYAGLQGSWCAYLHICIRCSYLSQIWTSEILRTAYLTRYPYAIGRVHPSVSSFFWTDWPLTLICCTCMGHYHSLAAWDCKSWLTPTDRATRCVTPSRHRAVNKAGRWVWSTGDGRRSTVDNTWRRSTCRRDIILSSKVWEKLQRKLCLFLEILEFHILFNKHSPATGAVSHRPEALDPVEAWPRTLCIGSKFRARHDCIDISPWSKYLFICTYQLYM